MLEKLFKFMGISDKKDKEYKKISIDEVVTKMKAK